MATKTRLNMEHGFMQSIIRNQLDRDNYDKEMKAKVGKKKTSSSLDGGRAKKPDVHTYTPPQARSHDVKHQKLPPDSYLFTFQYEDEDGKLFHLVVKKGDDGVTLAKSFGEERKFDPSLVEALSRFLQDEIDKHVADKNS